MQNNNHVAGLDRIRAIAALSVLLAHVAGPDMGDLKYIFTGAPAVIVFFIISGFCIHYPYTVKTLDVKAFWLSRAIRILIPAIIAIRFAKHRDLGTYNFTDGFILWSIVCELWYYFLYPFFLKLSKKIPFSTLWKLSFVPALTIAIYMGSDQYGSLKYGPWITWIIALPSWLMGCALAERKKYSGNVIWLRIITASTASGLYWLTLNTPIGYSLTLNFFAILAALWISAEIANSSKINVLDWVGKWSYSIYLFHVIIFYYLFNERHVAHPILWIPVILMACYLFYLLFEKPSHAVARYAFKKLRANKTQDKTEYVMRS